MTDSHDPMFDDGRIDPQWESLLRSILGDNAEDAIRELQARGFDPASLPGGAQMDPQTLQHALNQVQRMLATPPTSPVDPQVAHDVARQAAVAEGDPVVLHAQAKAATDALSVAELWLDVTTSFPPSGAGTGTWSRSEWVENTLPAWNALAAPVAASVADAVATVLTDPFKDDPDALADNVPAEARMFAQGLDAGKLMRRIGSAVFGMQIGQAVGTLSREVFGSTDIGVPLLPSGITVMLPTNVEAFADGLDAPLDEVRLFLALREAAHCRLFTHVTWLRGHLLGLIETYARGITIDLDELESRMASIDVSDTAALQQALTGGVFGLSNTPEQQATLLRLETTLALVEGWVDEVTAQAALPHLPHAVALREMLRRRRAAGGPAEHTFSTLVGLELRPRRSRDAAALWALIDRQLGQQGRDGVWDHPDLLPEPVDLDDPSGYADRRAKAAEEQADVDRALAEIFGEDNES